MNPVVKISFVGAKQVQAGQPWLLANQIVEVPKESCDFVTLVDQKDNAVATALYAAGTRMPVRVWSLQNEALTEDVLRKRLQHALQRRREWQGMLLWQPDAYRVVHGESDNLPGLFVDLYKNHVVLQTTTRAMDARKRWLVGILQKELQAEQVVVRDDGSLRDMEQLPREKYVASGPKGTLAQFHDAGSQVEADLLSDGKTGSFLDQQENHFWAYRTFLGKTGTALDAFAYHGGFALALARAGLQVWAGDENPDAVAKAQRNAALNGLQHVQFSVRNSFDWLRELESQGRRFDVVVIDPPALAKRGRQHGTGKARFAAAHRAYKELNLRALRLLQPGGYLVTCSCSGSLQVSEFAQILREASVDAKHPVHVIERRGAGRDHPALLGVPETDHLKCWVLRSAM